MAGRNSILYKEAKCHEQVFIFTWDGDKKKLREIQNTLGDQNASSLCET